MMDAMAIYIETCDESCPFNIDNSYCNIGESETESPRYFDNDEATGQVPKWCHIKKHSGVIVMFDKRKDQKDG